MSASCLPLSAGHTIAHRDASLAMHFPKIRNTEKHKIRNTTEEVKENAKNQSMEYTNKNDKYATSNLTIAVAWLAITFLK